MDFCEEIEPMHELPSETLEDFLYQALQYLKFLWRYAGDRKDSAFKEISHEADFDLKTVIHSIKKSLVYFYPYWTHQLSFTTSANEARHLLNILQHTNPRYYGFEEGVEAIFKIYLQIGFYYPCDPKGEALSDFQEMEQAIYKYTDIARNRYHQRKIDKERQASSKGGQQETYKEGIVLAIKKALQDAQKEGLHLKKETLWQYFEQNHDIDDKQKPIELENFSIYYLKGRLIQEKLLSGTVKIESISKSTFLRHYMGYVRKKLGQ